ncbi:efflux RND transporter permease subunit [Parvularcula oceani]|uniref:efflux RND transporter permease subunit n=1 Tax=Parvularcula oceani TaxID=1247963 RepID=UPI00068ACDB5|nr:efflux RND transporter permease subunit [Parvularcula oceani]
MGGNPLIQAAFDRAKVVMLALVVLTGFGIVSFLTLPREADPDIPLPFVQVLLPLPGVSPEDAERLLIRPSEMELQSLEGVIQTDATAYEGLGMIRLEFEPTSDMEDALSDVREAVDRAKTEFPAAALEPIVNELNAQSMFPVISVVVSGTAPERALYAAAQSLEDRLATLPGVLEVEMVGARDEVVEIVADPEALSDYGLSASEIGAALRANNALVTAGAARFSDASYSVKVPGLAKSLDDIRAVPLRADEDSVVTLGDVATVRRTFEDAEGFARFDGAQAIGLNISKRSAANLLDVTEAVKAEANAAAAEWPPTLSVAFTGDQSTLVESIFGSLTASIGLAILLVMIVVVGALGLRSALMVGVAIPCSFLIGFALIGMMGFTLNMLVMFSMVLSVGMLVDGAIVVVELADRRMAEGLSRRQAYQEAAERMFWPITASTATTLAAFIPFLFWQDLEGEFMKWIPITLIFVLTASLFVALIFLPLIGSFLGLPESLKRRFGLTGKTDGAGTVDMSSIDPTALSGFTGAYARFTAYAVRRPVMFIGLGALTVATCLVTFSRAEVEVEQFLRNDSEQVMILIQGRGNLSERDVLDVAQEVEGRIAGHPAIESIYLQTGPQVARSREAPAESIAQLTLDLLPYAERVHSLQVLSELRALTRGVPGVVLEIRQPESGPQSGKDVQIELRGPQEALPEAAALVHRFLDRATAEVAGRTVPAFADIEDNGPLPGVEWRLDVDREEAGRYGVSVMDVGAAVQLVTDGLLIDKYRPDDAEEELDVRLRYPADARSLSELTRIRIPTREGLVPLSNFVTRQPVAQVDRVVRRNGNRILELQANGSDRVPGHEVSQDRAIELATQWLESGALEEAVPGVQWRLRGASEDRDASTAFFKGAMTAAMVMIGVILLLQFNSFYHAALTLSAVVLSVFGVLFGVAVTGQYISVIMTGVGIVALAGIVVNNNIVLIDTYQSLRRAGLPVQEAVVRTAAQRLRPVLLTTGTTIIGLLPMVFELDIDFRRGVIGIGNATSDWWVLLSSAIVYGLAFSTLLTLILTPVLLAAPSVLEARLRRMLRRQPVRRRRRQRRNAPEGGSLPEGYSAAAE